MSTANSKPSPYTLGSWQIFFENILFLLCDNVSDNQTCTAGNEFLEETPLTLLGLFTL